MSLTTIIIIVLAVCGIGWCYPKLPSPFNIVLVVVVAVVCLLILLGMSGNGLHL